MPTVLAADFGGTNLRAAVVTGDGEILHRHEVDTPATAQDALAPILDLLSDVAARADGPLDACCIATAGLVDASRGRIIISPNIPAFRNLEIVAPAAERLGIPVAIENDASAAALGEHRYGAGRGFQHLVHITVGTGIGGGLVLGGKLYRGATGLAGEIGHMTIDVGGPPCTCGSRGCLESLASGWAFARRARRLIESGRSTILKDLVGEAEPTAEHLYDAAIAGDQAAEAEIRNAGHLLGVGIGSLINILNPQAITVSGGLVPMGEMYFGPARAALDDVAYGPAAGVELHFSTLDEDAGLLGAAAVALEYLEA